MTITPLSNFRQIIAKLRHPKDGCPWDLEQTHETLKPYIIEESYEVIDAIDSANPSKLCEELGDLFLQIMLHSQLASEQDHFDIEDVIKTITNKIIKRHPHVFGEEKAETAREVLQNWEEIKKQERGSDKGALDGIPKQLPALLKAQRMGEKTARLGFDWPKVDGVKSKIKEELSEFLESDLDSQEAVEEFGDLLFSLCQLARKIGIDSEQSLSQACQKFQRRFSEVEKKAGDKIKSMSIEELEKLWLTAKSQSA